MQTAAENERRMNMRAALNEIPGLDRMQFGQNLYYDRAREVHGA